jgi:hypothetical protein
MDPARHMLGLSGEKDYSRGASFPDGDLEISGQILLFPHGMCFQNGKHGPSWATYSPPRKQEIEFLLGVLPGFSAALLALQIRLVDSLRTGPGCCLVS